MPIAMPQIKKDHRELGKELNYFSFHEEGPGFPFFHHKGNLLKQALIEYWRKEHFKSGYIELSSPIMLNSELWEKSGHLDYFKENMFFSDVEKHEFAIKPMSCPGALLSYQEKKRSHRELPLRICELGLVHRNENSGSLHGLMRVRAFMQDDAHIFCSREQVKNEILNVLKLFKRILNRCGFHQFRFELSQRGESKSYLGLDADWDMAENYLAECVAELGWDFEYKAGEAKFYGPSLDLHIQDSKGKYWQCSTLQFDFNLPGKFNIAYYDEAGIRQIPIMLHRAIFGSLERFIGILLEHYQGSLPLWMAPVQARVLVIDDEAKEFASKIYSDLWDLNLRVDIDEREDHINSKIRKAREEKIPAIIVLGKQEVASGQCYVKLLEDHHKMEVSEFVKLAKS